MGEKWVGLKLWRCGATEKLVGKRKKLRAKMKVTQGEREQNGGAGWRDCVCLARLRLGVDGWSTAGQPGPLCRSKSTRHEQADVVNDGSDVTVLSHEATCATYQAKYFRGVVCHTVNCQAEHDLDAPGWSLPSLL